MNTMKNSTPRNPFNTKRTAMKLAKPLRKMAEEQNLLRVSGIIKEDNENINKPTSFNKIDLFQHYRKESMSISTQTEKFSRENVEDKELKSEIKKLKENIKELENKNSKLEFEVKDKSKMVRKHPERIIHLENNIKENYENINSLQKENRELKEKINEINDVNDREKQVIVDRYTAEIKVSNDESLLWKKSIEESYIESLKTKDEIIRKLKTEIADSLTGKSKARQKQLDALVDELKIAAKETESLKLSFKRLQNKKCDQCKRMSCKLEEKTKVCNELVEVCGNLQNQLKEQDVIKTLLKKQIL